MRRRAITTLHNKQLRYDELAKQTILLSHNSSPHQFNFTHLAIPLSQLPRFRCYRNVVLCNSRYRVLQIAMTNKCAWATTRCVKLYKRVYLCLTKQWQSCVITTTCYGTLVRSCIMCKDNCVSGTAGVCVFPSLRIFRFFLMVLSKTIRIIFIIKLFGSSHFFFLNLYNYNDVRFWLSTTMPFDCQT